jgi:hypothetical protein
MISATCVCGESHLRRFTGKERDAESGNDCLGARLTCPQNPSNWGYDPDRLGLCGFLIESSAV